MKQFIDPLVDRISQELLEDTVPDIPFDKPVAVEKVDSFALNFP